MRHENGGTIVAIVAAVVVGGVAASTVRADVDTTGKWLVQVTNVGGTIPPFIELWTQTGTAVSTSMGLAGTIDPSAGLFSLTRSNAMCPADTRNGSASLDNQTWTATEVDHIPGSPTLCFGGTTFQLSAERLVTCSVRSCRPAQINSFTVANAGTAQATLAWKWKKGTSTSLSDFGLPTGTTAYTLCVFAGTASALIGSADILPDGQKWQPVAQRGFRFKDPSGADEGISKILLIGGAAGKAKILVKGKGNAALPIAPPYDLPLIVQLADNGSDACWSATFDAMDVVQNQFGAFSAKFRSH